MKSIEELDRYPWSGHGVLIGGKATVGRGGNMCSGGLVRKGEGALGPTGSSWERAKIKADGKI